MNSKILPYLGILILGLAIGYFIGKGTTSSNVTAPKPVPTVKEEPVAEPVKPEKPEEPEVEESTPEEPIAENKPEEPSTTGNNSGSGSDALPSSGICFSNEDDFSLQLSLFAERMEAKKLEYDNKNPERLQDCSGIFHQTARFVKSKCDNASYPDPTVARDSRSLAKWYASQNNLVIIDDPKKKANLIKPGSVMFFGSSGKQYPSNVTVEQLASFNPKGIEHIGVVTKVIKEDGKVTGYEMFHGRRPGTHAQRSYYHSIKPPRLGYPVLGNWNQQWLAIANIMSPK